MKEWQTSMKIKHVGFGNNLEMTYTFKTESIWRFLICHYGNSGKRQSSHKSSEKPKCNWEAGRTLYTLASLFCANVEKIQETQTISIKYKTIKRPSRACCSS